MERTVGRCGGGAEGISGVEVGGPGEWNRGATFWHFPIDGAILRRGAPRLYGVRDAVEEFATVAAFPCDRQDRFTAVRTGFRSLVHKFPGSPKLSRSGETGAY